jgi:uncharacterized membrane protein
MINMKKVFAYMIPISAIFSSCYYDVQEELHPLSSTISCDTSNITFTGKVTDILRVNCYSCHLQSIASGGIVLDNYQSVKAVALNGRLAGSIDHLQGYSPMPQNVGQLSECDRLTIKNWIQNGSTNN